MLDRILPEPHNSNILDLVFVMGCWHAYAKLRVHTEETLTSFEQLTTDLGVLLRHFAEVTCKEFNTMELPRESRARIRRAADKSGSGGASTSGARPKAFNLSTYKLHALGDYPQTIRECGTTDNYTSQWVSTIPLPGWLPLITPTPGAGGTHTPHRQGCLPVRQQP